MEEICSVLVESKGQWLLNFQVQETAEKAKIVDQDFFSFLLNWLAVKPEIKKKNKTKQNKKTKKQKKKRSFALNLEFPLFHFQD